MDASDAFEDVGHSDEAREQLEKLLVGTLKEDPNAPKVTQQVKQVQQQASGQGGNIGVFVLVAALLAAAVYKFAM
jgi:cytochrome b involved in lipid metabolism